jgi:hypothetical protein
MFGVTLRFIKGKPGHTHVNFGVEFGFSSSVMSQVIQMVINDVSKLQVKAFEARCLKVRRLFSFSLLLHPCRFCFAVAQNSAVPRHRCALETSPILWPESLPKKTFT